MQIHAHPLCSKFQRVEFEGCTYELTRVGFGLACTPQILKAVVQYGLNLDEMVRRACSTYYDDIMVDLTQTSAERVGEHLWKYGLVAKPPKHLDRDAAIGSAVRRVGASLERRRPLKLQLDVSERTMKLDLFSMCCRLTSHFPVCRWLRVAAGFAKRACESDHWDTPLNDVAARFAPEMVDRIKREDPVKAVWLLYRNVPTSGSFEPDVGTFLLKTFSKHLKTG